MFSLSDFGLSTAQNNASSGFFNLKQVGLYKFMPESTWSTSELYFLDELVILFKWDYNLHFFRIQFRFITLLLFFLDLNFPPLFSGAFKIRSDSSIARCSFCAVVSPLAVLILPSVLPDLFATVSYSLALMGTKSPDYPNQGN